MFDWRTALGFLGIFLGLTWLFQWILLHVFHFRYSALFLSGCWVIVFFNSNLATVLHLLGARWLSDEFRYLWVIEIFITSAILYLSYRWSKQNELFNKLANTFLCFAMVVNGIGTAAVHYKTVTRISARYEANETNVGPAPHADIVWILMDEYAASSELAERFGFKNPLDTFLVDQGFVILRNVRSRSDRTLYSINSIFNLDETIEPYSFIYGHYSLKNNAWSRILAERGYRFINMSFFDIGDQPHAYSLNYYNETLLMRLIEGTPIKPLLQAHFKKLYYYVFQQEDKPETGYNGYILAELDKRLRDDDNRRPTFFWAHLLIPHGPHYRFDGRNLRRIPENDSDDVKKGYVEYLSYGNSVLENLWKSHPQLKSKIVIISGDHGARFDFIKGPDRTRPFCAVYMPGSGDSSALNGIQYISQLSAFLLHQ